MTDLAVNSSTQGDQSVEPQGFEPQTVSNNSRLGNFVIKGTPIITGAALATGCAYVGLNDPDSKQLFPACGFYTVTGFYCPGCGMTRAAHNVLNLNFLKAFQFNALLVIAIPVFMYLYVWWMTWAFTGKELPRIKMSRRATFVLFALIILFVFGRNFPGPVAEFFARDRV